MVIKILSSSSGISEEKLAEVETYFGVRFPDDYRRFLVFSNGCRPESNIFDIGGDNDSGVREFYSTDQSISEKDALSDRLPQWSWPIAEDECGNLVNLRYINEKWDVSFWDHELEEETVVAGSFDEFLNLLKPFDMSSVRLEPEKIISHWVHPDLIINRKAGK